MSKNRFPFLVRPSIRESKNEDNQCLEYEISKSITESSALLNSQVNSFTYPNGNPNFDFGQREIRVLAKNNIKLAFSTEVKPFTIKDNPLSIPRSGFESGSIPYMYLKLFLGSNWERLKTLLNKKDESSYCFKSM